MTTTGGGNDEVGSVSEEAAKLLGALQDWARAGGGEAASAASAAAGGLGGRWQEVNEHLATGGAECTYCPVCRAVALLRQTSPEVRTHLATAASSLLQAAAGLLETQVPPAGRREPGVQKIDLEGDGTEPGDGWDVE